MAVKKTKKEHLAALKSIQSSIGIQIVRVNKEAHIPIWMLRTWAADIKSAVSFMRKEMKFDCCYGYCMFNENNKCSKNKKPSTCEIYIRSKV